MQTLEKSSKKDKYPSFSSTLLDEIYRSIDKKEGEKNSCNGNGVRQKINNPIEEDEEMGSNLNRSACLIDKWMEKKVNGKMFDSLQDNDPLYFSSSSISSDSSCSGGFSSSDTEFFSATKMTKTRTSTRTSCFATSWKQPKPIKTKTQEKQEIEAQKDTPLIKSRSRAVKIYTNLKNLKQQQPISPGGRLTSFINSLFTTNGSNSSKTERKCKSNQTSACSSATSFSRSCLLSKTPSSTTTSRGSSSTSSKIHQNNNTKRTVSFTADEMRSRRTQCSEEMNKFREMDGLKAYKKDDFVVVEKISDFVEDGDEDAASDCSSDLFEIDHLVLFGGNKRFCEELPVYETTHLDKNLAILSPGHGPVVKGLGVMMTAVLKPGEWRFDPRKGEDFFQNLSILGSPSPEPLGT